MSPMAETIFRAWQPDYGAPMILLLVCALYVLGWRRLRRQRPREFDGARLVSFLSGIAAILLAIASPLDAFAPLLLTAAGAASATGRITVGMRTLCFVLVQVIAPVR